MLISLQNITFEFGSRVIVEEVNWQIGSNERIGLIGNNGTGKSTLLKVINGDLKPSSGQVQKAPDLKIAYFHQDLLSFDTEDNILEVAELGFEELQKTKKELSIYENKDPDSFTEKEAMDYSLLLHDFEQHGGYEMSAKASQILDGLGFSTHDLKKPFSQFSGGWKMRVLLAQLILQDPDVLLLDEPTNHLDLPSIQWLEKYLNHFPGAAVIVSHDRYFLDRMVTSIVEVFQENLHHYSGNYRFYEREKALRLEQLERDFESQQRYIAQQERFVERFKAKASKAKQAQSVQKKLDKLERVELEAGPSQINFKFSVALEPGKNIATYTQLSKKYENGPVIFDNTHIEINRGDKIALIGANGVGKSTLLKIISGLESYEGEFSGGHNVVLGFYAQHQVDSLNMEHSILEELMIDSFGKTELELRQLLGCFLFTGDDVYKKIKVLSGGERSRVALAKVIASKSNFLLLDEPTNHLDIISIDMLIQALNEYEGTYIIVSHDRHFVSKTADLFWHIDHHEVKSFKGTYEHYEEWLEKQKGELETAKKNKPAKKEVKKEVKKSNAVISDQEHRALNRQKRNLQRKLDQSEEKIEVHNQRIVELNLALSQAQIDNDEVKINETLEAIEEETQKLNDLEKDFEKTFEALLLLEDA